MSEEILEPAPDRLDRAAFVARFGGIYEHSAWIAEAAYEAGLDHSMSSPDRLAGHMAAIVRRASNDAKLVLLRAHPELVGKLALAGDLTSDSKSEQSSAGLDRCTPAEYAEFQNLNEQYNRKFGFPFIIAVRGLSRTDILTAFRARIGNDPETEFTTALSEVDRIARLRLSALARR